jgi:MarR family 2-MHQ and catechol resistance regulon transcriptional repressor
MSRFPDPLAVPVLAGFPGAADAGADGDAGSPASAAASAAAAADAVGCPHQARVLAEQEAAARRASYDPETAEALRVWVVLSRAYAAVQAHALDDITRHGLNLPEFGALEVLYHKGPLLVGDLQRTILMSSGGMTCLLDRLQRRGFVVRRDCPVDRRAVWVALTGEGVRFMDAAFPAHAARIRNAVAGIAPPERRPLLDALRRLGRYAADAARAIGAAPSASGAGAARASRRGRRPAATAARP